MIPPDFDIVDRIRAYTGGDEHQRRLRAEHLKRERVLACARECEVIAAMWQQIADDLREAA